MARVVYDYDIFTNVNGGSDLLSKLKTFAEAQGWVATYYETNVEWASDGDGTYSFAHAGSYDELELTSVGYGSQVLVYRFQVSNYDAQSDRIYMAGISPLVPSVDESNSDTPRLQNDFNYTSFSYQFVPSSTFPKLAIIGNDKVIALHIRCSTLLTLNMAFGTPEMIAEEAAETEFSFIWHGSNTYAANWYNVADGDDLQNFFVPFGAYIYSYFMDGSALQTTTFRPMFAHDPRESENPDFFWADREDLIAVNSYSGFRTLVANPAFRKNASTGVWRCVGHLPPYLIAWGGLTWGETITRGAEEYLVFPNHLITGKYGVAYRVA